MAGVVGEHARALGEGLGLGVGQIQHVNGAVEGCVGVGIAAEVHAHALEKLDEGAGRVVGAAVERHVFEEVGEAALGVGLVERAGGDDETEGGARARFGVGADGVANAVGERAGVDGGIGGEIGLAGGGGEEQRRARVGEAREDEGRLTNDQGQSDGEEGGEAHG